MVCWPLSNAHMSKLLATLLGVHVYWVAAKMQSHCAQSRPQRDYAAAVCAQHEHHLPRQIVATSTVHVADETFAGSAISLLGFKMLFPKHTMSIGGNTRSWWTRTRRTRMLASRCTGATASLSDPPHSYIYSVADTYFDHLTRSLRSEFWSLCRMNRTSNWVRSNCETLEGLHVNYIFFMVPYNHLHNI